MKIPSRDRTSPTTVDELRQYYNFDSILKNSIATQDYAKTISTITAEQSKILNSIILNMTGLESQTDMSLWFFNSIPSLETLPASEWDTTELKDLHLGDLYFNRETGVVYKFSLLEETYYWNITDDVNISQAMALTNAEIDTADSERKVFFTQPIPPYNNGDWWITIEGLYICQITKNINEIFNIDDFIIATKYTTGTQASEINGKLTVLSGQVTTIETNVAGITENIEDNKYYVDDEGVKHLISSNLYNLNKTVDGIDLQISKTGGSNIWNNPVGYFFNSLTNTADEWTGEANSYTDTEIKNNTISKNAFLLRNSTMEQIIQVPNGSYTVSFIYKKLIPLSEVSVIINGIVIELTEEDWKTETLTFEVLSNTIDIKLISDTLNSCYVSDLMGNLGTLGQVWSNNPSESVKGGVKIGNGIEVSSNTSNIMQKIDNDGNRIINTNTAQVVSEFTEKGLSTKEAKIETCQVAQVLIVDMGTQTWLSRM